MPMKPGSTKNLLLRLEAGLAERLQIVAEAEGRSVSDVVREAMNAALMAPTDVPTRKSGRMPRA